MFQRARKSRKSPWGKSPSASSPSYYRSGAARRSGQPDVNVRSPRPEDTPGLSHRLRYSWYGGLGGSGECGYYIVEDEKRMAEALRKGLKREGMSIALAFDGPSGLEAARSRDFDVIVLDVMLPGLDGFSVTRELRGQGVLTPILMLTARDASRDIVNGLSQGADDYLTKPFAFEVLLARLHALSRRSLPLRAPQLKHADLVLDPTSREVSRGGRKMSLTRTEYVLLEMLLRRSGIVLPRETLIEGVWGFGAEVENNTLEVFIGQLRAKVDRESPNKLIHTIRGVGYVLRDDVPK